MISKPRAKSRRLMAKRNRENRITHLYNGVVDAVNNLSLGVLGDLGSDILARERAETKEFLRGGMECRVRTVCSTSLIACLRVLASRVLSRRARHCQYGFVSVIESLIVTVR